MKCVVDGRCDATLIVGLTYSRHQTDDGHTRRRGREGHGLSDVGDQFLRGDVATRLDLHSVD